MRDREVTNAIRVLAEAQHGVVSTRQLLEDGISEDAIRSRVEGRFLIPLHRGAFALGHKRLTREGRWMAAVLACGPGAALSHFSAGHLWNVCGSYGPVEVLRRSGGATHEGLRLHQTRRLELYEVTLEKGIPVTSVERTLLDLAGRMDAKRIERALVQADKSGSLSWPALARILVKRRGRRGAGRLKRIAAEVDPRAIETLSVTEVDFLALWRDTGLPPPAVNVLLEGHLVDFLWPQQKVVVETDSWAFHGDRPTFERDRQTDVDLVAAGYDVHRATYKMLEREPDRFIANVCRALRTRTASSFRAASPET